MKIWLKIPDCELQQAIELGCKKDKKNGIWFINCQPDFQPIMKWVFTGDLGSIRTIKKITNGSLCKLAHKLGMAGNVGKKAVGEKLICHFGWSGLTPKDAISKYLSEKPLIFGIAPYKKSTTSYSFRHPESLIVKTVAPKTNLPKYSHPLLGKTEYKDFYNSTAWKQLRYLALKNNGVLCQCCGAKAGNGVQIHVDHIKPRSRYPELELCLDNLQVLCSDCNIGKGAWDDTDFR